VKTQCCGLREHDQCSDCPFTHSIRSIYLMLITPGTNSRSAPPLEREYHDGPSELPSQRKFREAMGK